MARQKQQPSKRTPTTVQHYSNPGRKANPSKPSRWRAYLGEARDPMLPLNHPMMHHTDRDRMGLTPWSGRVRPPPISNLNAYGRILARPSLWSDYSTRYYFQPRIEIGRYRPEPYEMRVANEQWRKWNPKPTTGLSGGVPSLQTLARQSIRGLDRYALKPDGSFNPPRD